MAGSKHIRRVFLYSLLTYVMKCDSTYATTISRYPFKHKQITIIIHLKTSPLYCLRQEGDEKTKQSLKTAVGQQETLFAPIQGIFRRAENDSSRLHSSVLNAIKIPKALFFVWLLMACQSQCNSLNALLVLLHDVCRRIFKSSF